MDDPRAGKIVGTPDYLSPEQIRTPLEVGPVSDVYSLGCTLYYAICGKVPFPGGDTAQKVRMHLEETPFHPRRFAPNISEEFVEIIAEMMDKNPNKRTQSCAEVVSRLEPWAMQSAALHQPRMSRGPWSAPPLPQLDSESTATKEDTLQETSIQSNDSNQANGLLPENLQSMPQLVSVTPIKKRNSASMLIALTIAILLPPALLVGAIVGYLIALR